MKSQRARQFIRNKINRGGGNDQSMPPRRMPADCLHRAGAQAGSDLAFNEGCGGGFQFCRLSAEPLFDADGQIRADVKFAQLAEFVWFAETGTGFTGTADSPLLGIHEGRAIYLLYNGILKDKSVAGGNVLTGPVFDVLPKFSGPKVIYAAANRMGARAAREGITFKQTPYALEV